GVEYFDLELVVRLAQYDLAMLGARMPDHVRRRLADHPTEHGFGLSVERTYALAHVDVDSSCFQRDLSGAQLGGQRRLPVPGYCIPYLPEGLAAESHHVFDFSGSGGSFRKQSRGQLTFQRDQRETVAEQVVQVPRDARPLAIGRLLCDYGACGP